MNTKKICTLAHFPFRYDFSLLDASKSTEQKNATKIPVIDLCNLHLLFSQKRILPIC